MVIAVQFDDLPLLHVTSKVFIQRVILPLSGHFPRAGKRVRLWEGVQGARIRRCDNRNAPVVEIDRDSRDSETCAILNIAPSPGFTRLHAMAIQKTQLATHVMCPGVPLDAGRAGLRSPNLDELDALMEKVAPAVGDSAKATLVLALALIDVFLLRCQNRNPG